MASFYPLLLLLVKVLAASAQNYRYYGGSVTFTPKRQDSSGMFEVCLGVMGISEGKSCHILSDTRSFCLDGTF